MIFHNNSIWTCPYANPTGDAGNLADLSGSGPAVFRVAVDKDVLIQRVEPKKVSRAGIYTFPAGCAVFINDIRKPIISHIKGIELTGQHTVAKSHASVGTLFISS